MIQRERTQALNENEIRKGKFVLYWMQASQRVEYNHALEYAILKANELLQPVLVFFGITDHFPEGNERHYHFMLEGIKEATRSLEKRGIRMVIEHRSPELGIVKWAKEASLVVVDRGYLRIQKEWRNDAARRLNCPLIQVESDVVVPVEEASPKEEYAAATLRPKLRKRLDRFLVPLKVRDPVADSLSFRIKSFDLENLDKALSKLGIDRGVKRVEGLHGGTGEAKLHLKIFLDKKLDRYAEFRNDPTLDGLSKMSPYLHFGQISPLYIALKVMERKSPGQEAFLEELIVRRELSVNFTFYNEKYDSFDSVPGWAKQSLSAHRKDKRDYLYTLEELESAQTHDPYWNAAQKEMVLRGKMHGYMRMYWGKKILEWSKTPDEAFRNTLYLNNRYELDGRDPNGFAGVAWCFGKHDRPWGERSVFGNIRYMNDKGLLRKFDADRYVKTIADLGKGLSSDF
ncbi:MAG: deoxyribodipyrimidine photolyase [Deltaproteobacteria bacterium]|nr:deoxyribodipyrimidine photolyase [Deltaproteobacteria bacterium]